MLPPLSQKLTQEEKDRATQFALWLEGSVNSKHPSPTELDAWALYRHTLELKEELAQALRLTKVPWQAICPECSKTIQFDLSGKTFGELSGISVQFSKEEPWDGKP